MAVMNLVWRIDIGYRQLSGGIEGRFSLAAIESAAGGC
jgi:hypothetical protein